MFKSLEGAALPRLGGAVFLLLLLFSFANGAYANLQTGSNGVQQSTLYQTWRDEYRTDFYVSNPDWDTGRLFFENALGVPFQIDFSPSQMQGRIMYLTCNGSYQLQFLRSGTVVYWSDTIVTAQILQPSCNSYTDGGARNDLGATWSENNGTYSVTWNDLPGSSYYEVWKDGNMIDIVPATGGPHQYDLPGSGAVTIVARDGSGSNQGHSDLQVPDYAGENPCDVCKKIRDALACPEWGTYMGELTRAIKNALPTLPEWRNIADQFVDAFADYWGEVPNPPSTGDIAQQIVPELPPLETNVPGSDIMPMMPPEYNQPINFDITTGQEIEIIDESEPFEIYEPNEFIDSDDPGVMVFPGDPRNHSGGIKQPDTIQTPYPEPIPTIEHESEIPPAYMPVPSGLGGTMPIPGITTGAMPIPNGG